MSTLPLPLSPAAGSWSSGMAVVPPGQTISPPAVREEGVADSPADDDELGARLAQRHGEAPIRARHELQVADLHFALALRDIIQGHGARCLETATRPDGLDRLVDLVRILAVVFALSVSSRA